MKKIWHKFSNAHPELPVKTVIFNTKEIIKDSKVDENIEKRLDDLSIEINNFSYKGVIKYNELPVKHVYSGIVLNDRLGLIKNTTTTEKIITIEGANIKNNLSYINKFNNKIQHWTKSIFTKQDHVKTEDFTEDSTPFKIYKDSKEFFPNFIKLDITETVNRKLLSTPNGTKCEILDKPASTLELIKIDEVQNNNLKELIKDGQKLSDIIKNNSIITSEQIAIILKNKLPKNTVVLGFLIKNEILVCKYQEINYTSKFEKILKNNNCPTVENSSDLVAEPNNMSRATPLKHSKKENNVNKENTNYTDDEGFD